MNWLSAVISAALVVVCRGHDDDSTLDQAVQYLKGLDKKYCKIKNEQQVANFNYNVNSTDENLKKRNDAYSKGVEHLVVDFEWERYDNPYVLREAKAFGLLNPKPDPQLKKALDNVVNDMSRIQSDTYKVCLYKKRNVCSGIEVEQALYILFMTSTDLDELKYYWTERNKDLPRKIRPFFEQYVKASNALATNSSFANMADEWQDNYEQPPVAAFKRVMMNVWGQIKPLYKQYFTFLRKGMRNIYGKDKLPATGPIPIHLFSYSVGETLGYDYRADILPYPKKSTSDVTDGLGNQNYTGYKVARTVESYFNSMGLGTMPDTFWKYSLLRKDFARKANCETKSYSFYNGEDYRLVDCSNGVDQWDMTVYVRQVCYIYAYMLAKNQPCVFQGLTNKELTEAIADAMVLAFTSNQNFERMGLLKKDSDSYDPELQMNDLFYEALQVIGYMPMALAFDLYRWDIFEGKITPDNFNSAYWNYRQKYQGVVPPSPRSEEYLDAGSFYDVANNKSTIGDFMKNLLKYQIFETLCTAAGQFDQKNPSAKSIQECDLYGSKAAGDILRKMLTPGSSEPWGTILELGTKKSYIDPGSLVRYFEPLYKFMKAENKKTGEYVGWK